MFSFQSMSFPVELGVHKQRSQQYVSNYMLQESTKRISDSLLRLKKDNSVWEN